MERLKELRLKKEAGTITEEETAELESLEEKVEVGDDVVKAVAKAVEPTISETVKSAVNEAFAGAKADLEKTIDKHVNAGTKQETEMSLRDKKLAFFAGAKALYNKDAAGVQKYNKLANAELEKAGYANETTNADGGFLISLPEFEADVEKLLPVYGVAFREADVRSIRSNSIKTNKLSSGATMYETSEGGLKTGTKLTIGQVEVTLRKFAAIAIATDELVEDSAIDFWAEVTDSFARERARIADLMVFTENGTVYKGALRKAGIFVETVGAAITSITWDDLLNAKYKVPTEAHANGKYFMHRTIWNILLQTKDSQGRYQALPFNGLRTPWGDEVVLVDVMPTATDYGDANEPYVLFGDLKRVKLYVKEGLRLDWTNQATVHDTDNNAVNLFEKNMQAMRGETRMVALVKFPDAFCAIGTGSVS